jgi:hypothetical protein
MCLPIIPQFRPAAIAVKLCRPSRAVQSRDGVAVFGLGRGNDWAAVSGSGATVALWCFLLGLLASGRGGSPWREINNPCSAAQAWPLRLPRAIHTTTTSTAAVGLFVEFATTTVRDGSHLSRDDKGVLLHRMPSWPPLAAGVTFARVLARLASDVESLSETPDDGPCPSIRVDGGHIGQRCI